MRGVYYDNLPFKLLLWLVINMLSFNAQAGWYTGGAVLLHPIPYKPIDSNNIKLGSSKLNTLANGISIHLGYQSHFSKYTLASEFDIGGFSDADGNIIYQDIEHFVSASYYMALKEKFGFHFTPNVTGYGVLGFSENSIGDRVYITAEYFNKKQLSFLYGGGLEYYLKRNQNVALYAECFYFTPTHGTLYSGGANASQDYSLSVQGLVSQLGMRYYFV